jgi:YfiH family protein
MFYASSLMAKHNVKALFSDREGGCSPYPFDGLNLGLELGDTPENVAYNLKMLCESSGMPQPHQAKQVHGIHILHCQGTGDVHQNEADILIATTPHASIAVRTADCLPILLVDKQAQVAAAVHAGWRGTVAKVVAVAVEEMCALGASEENILASLGPCIGLCCFAVSEDVGEQMVASCGEHIVVKKDGVLFADLQQTNVFQLLSSGLKKENIEVSVACTSCHSSPSYFSYRRDKGEAGRQLAMIRL